MREQQNSRALVDVVGHLPRPARILRSDLSADGRVEETDHRRQRGIECGKDGAAAVIVRMIIARDRVKLDAVDRTMGF